MIRADKRKGLVIVKRNTDDQLIHFTWKDRTTGAVELDLILFPDDANWRRVKECTTGRVYVLEFKTGTHNFFWMQEPSTAKDDEHAESLNDHINNRTPSNAGGSNLQSLLGQLGGGAGSAYEQMASMSRGSSSTTTAANRSSSTDATSGSSATASASTGSSSLSARLQEAMNRIPIATAAPQPRLGDVVSAQEVLSTGALSEDAVLAELQKHLPEGESNSVIDTLRSPQFKQAVNHLNAILKESPEALPTLLATFGIANPSEPAANRVETFLKAIQESAKKADEKTGDSSKKPEEKDDSKMDQS